nr:hypothetical protein [Tanacetum cinerariifolium]
MSFGSQAAGEAVVLKFDMHVYTFVLTSDEVKNLVDEYAIPSDLLPCVPPSGLTMNKLPVDKIVPLGLKRLTMFEIYCRSLEINPSVNLFCAFYKLNKQGHWFSFERHSGKGSSRAILDSMPWRHQDSSVADSPPTGVRAEEILRLCKHAIDLRPVHLAMLYAVGLTTIWKHVEHHLVFKDGEGNGVSVGKGTTLAATEAIPQHSTPPLLVGDPIPKKTYHQRVVKFENERILAAYRKTQASRDRAAGKRSAAEGASLHTKKRKTAPLSFALDESEGDDSTRTGSGTHHSASLIIIIILDDATQLLQATNHYPNEHSSFPLNAFHVCLPNQNAEDCQGVIPCVRQRLLEGLIPFKTGFSMMLLEHQDIVAEFCDPSRQKELSKESGSKILARGDGSCWKEFKPIAGLIAKGKLK